MTDDVLDAARDAMLDLAVEDLLDGVRDRVTEDLRDWFASYSEWLALGRHLARSADTFVARSEVS